MQQLSICAPTCTRGTTIAFFKICFFILCRSLPAWHCVSWHGHSRGTAGPINYLWLLVLQAVAFGSKVMKLDWFTDCHMHRLSHSRNHRSFGKYPAHTAVIERQHYRLPAQTWTLCLGWYCIQPWERCSIFKSTDTVTAHRPGQRCLVCALTLGCLWHCHKSACQCLFLGGAAVQYSWSLILGRREPTRPERPSGQLWPLWADLCLHSCQWARSFHSGRHPCEPKSGHNLSSCRLFWWHENGWYQTAGCVALIKFKDSKATLYICPRLLYILSGCSPYEGKAQYLISMVL